MWQEKEKRKKTDEAGVRKWHKTGGVLQRFSIHSKERLCRKQLIINNACALVCSCLLQILFSL